MVLELLLSGCAPEEACATFDELQVEGEELVTRREVDTLLDAVHEFARWTGRDGVCVSTIRFVEDLGETPSGHVTRGEYTRAKGLVSLDAHDADFWQTTHHELCHALDYHEGHAVGAVRQLFPPRRQDGDHREAFAEACGHGPQPLEQRLLLAECEPVRPGDRYLAERVYTEYDRGYEVGELRTERVELPELPVDDGYFGGPVAGREAVYLLRTDRLLQVHVDAAREIPLPDLGPDARWHLFGGDREAPLLVALDDGVTAWRVDEQAIELVPAWFPDVERLERGVLADGAAWVEADFGDGRQWVRVDLVAQRWARWALPDLGGSPWDFRAGAGKLATPWFGLDSEVWLAVYSIAGDSWQVVPWPQGLIPVNALPTSGGDVLARWLGGDDLVGGLARVDPATGKWTVDSEVCGANRTNTGGLLLTLGDEPVLFEWADPLDVHTTHGLVQIW